MFTSSCSCLPSPAAGIRQFAASWQASPESKASNPVGLLPAASYFEKPVLRNSLHLKMDDGDSGQAAFQNEEILTQEKTAEARRWIYLFIYFCFNLVIAFVFITMPIHVTISAFSLFEKDGQVSRDDLGQVNFLPQS